jgi:hypothetical protein
MMFHFPVCGTFGFPPDTDHCSSHFRQEMSTDACCARGGAGCGAGHVGRGGAWCLIKHPQPPLISGTSRDSSILWFSVPAGVGPEGGKRRMRAGPAGPLDPGGTFDGGRVVRRDLPRLAKAVLSILYRS